MNLKGKTVLVTGAARGIGQAIAVELARAGAHIFALDLHRQDLESTMSEVEAVGGQIKAFEGDVADREAMRRFIDELFMLHGGFDVLVNNAGVILTGPFAGHDPWSIQKLLDINLTAAILLTRYSLDYLLKREEAHIVNLASLAGKFAPEGLAVYAAAKHGIVGFSSALREELREHGIGVSWICPSFVQTRMVENIQRTFLTPLVQPDDVARAVRQAIEKNLGEVFVPRSMRWSVGKFSAVMPGLARRMLRKVKHSRSWYEVKHDTLSVGKPCDN